MRIFVTVVVILDIIAYAILVYIIFRPRLNVMTRLSGSMIPHTTCEQMQPTVVKESTIHGASGMFVACLFGRVDWYLPTLLRNADDIANNHPTLPRGWMLRVYIDENCPREAIDALIEHKCEIVVVSPPAEPGDLSGTVWRMLAFGVDSRYQHMPVICIDADDQVSQRKYGNIRSLHAFEKRWHASSKQFARRHILLSTFLIPLCAGGVAGHTGSIPDIAARISTYDFRRYGADEAFLTREIWSEFQRQGFFDDKSNAMEAGLIGTASLGLLLPVLML